MQSSAAAAAAAAAATATATTGLVGAVDEDEVVDEEDEEEEAEEDDGSLLGLLRELTGVEEYGQLESSVLVESVTEILLDLALVSIPVLRGVSLKEPCRDTDKEPSGVNNFDGAFTGVCASSKSSVHETESLFSTTNLTIEEDCWLFLSNDIEWSMCSGPKDLDSLGDAS